MTIYRLFAVCFLLSAVVQGNAAFAGDTPRLTVGSKAFTESVILAEILTRLAADRGAETLHKRQLGGTRVLWNGLLNGDIDAYPEYTGTLRHEILATEQLEDEAALRAALHTRGLHMTEPLGFNNSYALAVRADTSNRLGLQSISDLAQHPALKLGFGNEFMNRRDGWPGLRERYALTHENVRGLDHDLAYRGLDSASLDVIDVYTTDAEIAYYDLHVLRDDKRYFPEYQAVIVYRADLAERAPQVVEALQRLAGAIDAESMQKMNARVKLAGDSEAQVAADFLHQTMGLETRVSETPLWRNLWRHTLDHLVLVGISLSAAIAVAIPLGIAAARRPGFGQYILSAVGILQTIPSLALFVFMIPLLGIGAAPAITALFLYSLLPIVRNTYAGLHDIPRAIVESAQALGLSPAARLRIVELPLATRAILAGIKTSAVINVGTATLGALIGAGGYGQPILTGIRLDDMGLILQGAVPAALLALLVQGLFELVERALLPRSLRYAGPGAAH